MPGGKHLGPRVEHFLTARGSGRFRTRRRRRFGRRHGGGFGFSRPLHRNRLEYGGIFGRGGFGGRLRHGRFRRGRSGLRGGLCGCLHRPLARQSARVPPRRPRTGRLIIRHSRAIRSRGGRLGCHGHLGRHRFRKSRPDGRRLVRRHRPEIDFPVHRAACSPLGGHRSIRLLGGGGGVRAHEASQRGRRRARGHPTGRGLPHPPFPALARDGRRLFHGAYLFLQPLAVRHGQGRKRQFPFVVGVVQRLEVQQKAYTRRRAIRIARNSLLIYQQAVLIPVIP